MFIGMIAAAVIGVFVSNPTITTPAFTGFVSESGSYLFPTLFVTIACGAVGGSTFHWFPARPAASRFAMRRERPAGRIPGAFHCWNHCSRCSSSSW
ncbi:MAG: carbon starvation CstA family protein [Merdibacter sp.]